MGREGFLGLRVIIFTCFDPLFNLTGHSRPIHILYGHSKASLYTCVSQVHVLLNLGPHGARDHKSLTAEDETIIMLQQYNTIQYNTIQYSFISAQHICSVHVMSNIVV